MPRRAPAAGRVVNRARCADRSLLAARAAAGPPPAGLIHWRGHQASHLLGMMANLLVVGAVAAPQKSWRQAATMVPRSRWVQARAATIAPRPHLVEAVLLLQQVAQQAPPPQRSHPALRATHHNRRRWQHYHRALASACQVARRAPGWRRTPCCLPWDGLGTGKYQLAQRGRCTDW